jgi:chromosomal replication initiation ATPase DnaA
MTADSDPSGRQLALPFAYVPRFRVEDFIPASSNAEARAWLGRTADWPGRRLALHGEAGCGKTHLVQLWAERHGALLLDGPNLRGLPELGGSPAIAVDDADAAPDERVLLHLINLASEMRRPLLLAARLPPARWATPLPDLASRLRATTAVGLRPAEEPLLRALLARSSGSSRSASSSWGRAFRTGCSRACRAIPPRCGKRSPGSTGLRWPPAAL